MSKPPPDARKLPPPPPPPPKKRPASAFQKQEGGDHYKACPIQPAEFAIANGLGFVEGNVVKYVTRWKQKGGVEDLKKARHYLDMLIESTEAPEVEKAADWEH